jgi:hypothetical protein
MHIIQFFACLAVLIFTTLILTGTAAQAESPYKGGMNYTAVRKHPSPPPETIAPAAGESSAIHFKEITPKTEQPKPAEETPASKVWKKYKSLASGTYEEPAEDKKQEETPPETAPQAARTAEAPPPAKPTGMAAIIDEYRKNKTSQSQMRTLRMEQPETHTTKTPETNPDK